MGAVDSIAENLIAAGIGGALAAGWRIAYSRKTSKYTRAMWSPFLKEDSCVVEGRLTPQTLIDALPAAAPREELDVLTDILPSIWRKLDESEYSGLMGRGDHEAIVRIQAGLARVGLRATVPVKADDDLGDDLTKNLIVVGGPDVNSVTKDLLALLRCGVTIMSNEDNRNVVRDLVHQQSYAVTSEETTIRDYGILVKAPSPYQDGRFVIVIAGAHGYGSVAAAQLALTPGRQLYQLNQDHPRGFECIVVHRRGRNRSNISEENTIVLERAIEALP